MPKEYVFEFQGTKENFLDMLNQIPSYDGKLYYIDEYIVKLIGDEIHFGVERGGHSGGYWFVPTITETDNCVVFRGTVQYIGPNKNAKGVKKNLDKICGFLLLIMVLPVVLIFMLYAMMKWCIRKLRKQTNLKEKTTEDRLYDLMENYLSCTGK